ncbi:penicillin acylase family protein [Rhizocola hellebori]|nr:penicillin acylase family protein [Rhizocola hellebori]
MVFVLTVAGLGYKAVRDAFPQHEGTLQVKGLSAPVTVYRDQWGIPQLYAKTEADLMRAQGYTHAQDRFWEMDFRRHVTAGRVSELFGASQVETDTYLRTMGWRRVSEQEWPLLSEPTKAALTAYAEGVNAWLDEHPEGNSLEYSILGLQNSDYVIEKWHPIDSLSWLKAMAWDLRGNMEDEIRRMALLAKGLTKAQVDELYPAYPFDRNVPIVPGAPVAAASVTPMDVLPAAFGEGLSTLEASLAALPGLMGNADGDGIGSNSWVISGKLSGSGKPILANDPHLSPSQPGIWYQIGLHCECGLDVAGFSFSGVPGVIIGHNAKIAWGFTNLGPDVIDMYVEDLATAQLTSRTETIKVAGGKDVTITVRTGKHGPILSDASEDLRKLGGGKGIAIRWTALDPGRTGDAIMALNKAANWQDFRTAASLFEVPAQNMVYADVEGNIGYQSPGKIPVRGKGDGRYFAPGDDPAYDWTGYIPFEELPSVYNPPQGYLVTANQAVIGPQYPHLLTNDWSYGYRSQRLNDLISASGTSLTVDDVQRMQFDNKNGFAPTLVPLLTAIKREGLSKVEKEADGLLPKWNFMQGEDSPAAAYYNAIWRQLLLLTFDELGKEYAPNGGDRWFEVMRGLLSKPDSPWWDDQATPEVEKRDDMLARAMSAAVKELSDLLGESAGDWRWGALHTLTPTHATFGKSGIAPIEWLFNLSAQDTAGGASIVNATGWNAGKGYAVDAVPSMRMIVDLANVNESRWIQLTGNSGHPFHPNYSDQMELWRTGQTITFRFDRKSIEDEKTQTLTLTP